MSFPTLTHSFICKHNSSLFFKTLRKCYLLWGASKEYPQGHEFLSPLEFRRNFFSLVPLAFICQRNWAIEPLTDGKLVPWLPEVPESSWSFRIAHSPQDEFLAV